MCFEFELKPESLSTIIEVYMCKVGSTLSEIVETSIKMLNFEASLLGLGILVVLW